MFSANMEKRSYKQSFRPEKVNMGCMSGLIRMFDFRRTPKLISDGNHGISRQSGKIELKDSEDHYGIVSDDKAKENGVEKVCDSRPSIKILMEQEMTSSMPPLKQAQSDVFFGVCSNGLKSVSLPEASDIDLRLAASLMEIYRKHNEGQDISDSVESGHTSNSTDTENYTDSNARLNRIPSSIQKALEDVAEAVIRHQLADTKYITSRGAARSKEFVDALQLLSSDREFFLMLLQDPNSRLLQCLQNLYTLLGGPKLEPAESAEEMRLPDTTSSLEQPEVSPCNVQRRQNSFLKEDKLVMRKPSKLKDSSHGLSRIVILKPSPGRSQNSLNTSSATSSPLSNGITLQGQEDGMKSAHHFSLRELKRRLRLAISDNRKGHKLSFMDSAFHRVDSTKQLPVTSLSTSLASADASYSERAAQPSITDKETKSEYFENRMENDVIRGVSSFSYEEAKKHLIERIGDEGDDNSQIVHKLESLGRLISFPEYDSLSPSHCFEEGDVGLSHETSDSSPLQTIGQEDDSASSCLSGQYQEIVSSDTNILLNEQLDEVKRNCVNARFQEEIISQKLNEEDVKDIQDVMDKFPLCTEIKNSSESLKQENSDQCSLEEAQSTNAFSELSLYSPDNLSNELEELNPSTAPESAKPSVLAFPCSPENANDKEEKLSPLSVLDSFLGDSTSPSHKTQKHDELPMLSSRILFKELDTPPVSPTLQHRPAILDDNEARLSFVKAVLDASELLAEDESSEKWYMIESLFDTSVFAEIRNSYCLTDDTVLLFDCVVEVLVVIRDKFYSVDRWLAVLNQNVRPAPVGENLIREVAKHIDLLASGAFPCALDEAVMRDLEGRSWMDLRCDSGSVVVEVWDSLLDDLLEEMVFDLWL